MSDKRYYSERHNLRQRDKYNESELSELFVQTYYELSEKKLFEELIGYHDKWGNWQRGLIANSFDTFVFKRIGKRDLVPIDADLFYREEDVFDLIELFYDFVSEPISNSNQYDKEAGRNEFREEFNRILNNYQNGYELTEEGYIRELVDNGLEELLDSKQEFINDDVSEDTVQVAKKKFFHHKADETDKRSAILEIGGVLEKLQKTKKLSLNNKDENDLFNVLNGFNLRHNRPDQKPNYDKDIFYPWIFYNLLSGLDASLKLQKKSLEELDF
ncbi:hypothetical protein [Metabacillus sediminilitoris]|uniref:Uncharacterized protein n=1 Tax=Metabacillus sediminilitoris TaxID=2567941 RepID=A0A4S4BZ75_9BACI|nr:hypothetical protein [Metabacillus sediminilitoris]QGQ47254.1 hypothetical protein GMB29_19565 [Metabacillus sediminilitoris]THF80596.1 hypothetical protein E6W99_09360 [Metabacillus sediminilitoris]